MENPVCTDLLARTKPPRCAGGIANRGRCQPIDNGE